MAKILSECSASCTLCTCLTMAEGKDFINPWHTYTAMVTVLSLCVTVCICVSDTHFLRRGILHIEKGINGFGPTRRRLL